MLHIGKFGQKFVDKDNWIPADTIDYNDLIEKYDQVESMGEFIRVKSNEVEPSAFCIPIWASYVTSYARIKLHKAIVICNPIYVDTDSLITKTKMPNSSKLGDLKLEFYVEDGVIVRPKFYINQFMGRNKEGLQELMDYVKIKGVSIKDMTFNEILHMMENPTQKEVKRGIFKPCLKFSYKKFMKFKECIRRDMPMNLIVDVDKELLLEDEKRKWERNFDVKELQHSKPLEVNQW